MKENLDELLNKFKERLHNKDLSKSTKPIETSTIVSDKEYEGLKDRINDGEQDDVTDIIDL